MATPGTFRDSDGSEVELTEAREAWAGVAREVLVATASKYRATITYKELAIEAGSNIDGKLSPLDAKTPARSGKSENKARKSNDYGAELPFEGKAVAAE